MTKLDEIRARLEKWKTELPHLIQPGQSHLQNIEDFEYLLAEIERLQGEQAVRDRFLANQITKNVEHTESMRYDRLNHLTLENDALESKLSDCERSLENAQRYICWNTDCCYHVEDGMAPASHGVACMEASETLAKLRGGAK